MIIWSEVFLWFLSLPETVLDTDIFHMQTLSSVSCCSKQANLQEVVGISDRQPVSQKPGWQVGDEVAAWRGDSFMWLKSQFTRLTLIPGRWCQICIKLYDAKLFYRELVNWVTCKQQQQNSTYLGTEVFCRQCKVTEKQFVIPHINIYGTISLMLAI